MITLPMYAKIKDRYCIGYFGESPDVLTQLIKARPIIEKELPGIKVYICCSDEKATLLSGEANIILKSELKDKIKEVAYFREMINETVVDLLNESEIAYDPKIFEK